MKSNDDIKFEELLADVEHAGRDARRREQLSDMIDRMAATENTKHGFWWWSARVAAAACVLFFISTAVRAWFIPTETTAQMVAENRMESKEIKVDSEDSTVPTPVKATAPHRVTAHRCAVTVAEETIVGETIAEEIVVEEPAPFEEMALPAIEELIAEEVEIQAEEEPMEEQEESTVESIAAPVVSVAYSEPQEQPRRRSLFRIHLTEPDIMEGNILALKLL